MRWFQFGVFSPIMRLHGVRKKQTDYRERHPGIIEPSGGDNEIWSFGERNYPILKGLIELRERLKPYIIGAMDQAAEQGMPVMRPMFLDYWEDETCYGLWDQYLFGPDILFAPITEEGQTRRKVYLPQGRWIRTTDRSAWEGGQFIECEAEINEFIAFAREGAEVLEVF